MPDLRALPAARFKDVAGALVQQASTPARRNTNAFIFDEADTEPSNPPTITTLECQEVRDCFLAVTIGQPE